MGRPILANLPPYPRPIVSDFDKPTYLPKDRTSYVDGPLPTHEIVILTKFHKKSAEIVNFLLMI